jgi:hypothetical protein
MGLGGLYDALTSKQTKHLSNHIDCENKYHPYSWMKKLVESI